MTPLEFSPEELTRAGERINNLERLLNVREGFSRREDTLPERFRVEPLKEGPSKESVVDLEPMLDEYYQARGWDLATGFPSPQKLAELDLTAEMKATGPSPNRP